MFSQGVCTDGKGGQHLGGRKQGMHSHTHQHDDGSCLIECLGRQHIKSRQNKYQSNAGQFPEELRDSTVQLAHAHHFRQKIVQHSFVQAVGEAGDQDRQKKHLESGALLKNVLHLID